MAWKRLAAWVGAWAVVTGACDAGGWFRAGREIPPERDAGVRIGAGSVLRLECLVQETHRPFYDLTNPEANLVAERYDLGDFDLDAGLGLIELTLEKHGRHFGVQWNVAFTAPGTETVARRDYYIGISRPIVYEGQRYEYMMIPEGTPFSLDVLGLLTDVRLMWTPFTLAPTDGIRFVPWLDVGLLAFAGDYDLDAGAPSGVIQYQNPPEDFVVGGRASGLVAAGLPEAGAGAELRFGRPGGANLVLQVRGAALEYSGSSSYLTTSRHREKVLTVDHVHVWGRCAMEIPLRNGRFFTAGIACRLVESQVDIRASGRSEEEILRRRERFNKEADFALLSVTFNLGLQF